MLKKGIWAVLRIQALSDRLLSSAHFTEIKSYKFGKNLQYMQGEILIIVLALKSKISIDVKNV